MKILTEALQGMDGSISCIRLACLLIVVAVLFNWCFLTVQTKQAQPLPWSEVTLILGAMGVKAIQRPFEKSVPTVNVTTTTGSGTSP